MGRSRGDINFAPDIRIALMSTENLLRRYLFFITVMLTQSIAALGQKDIVDGPVATNLDVMRSLAERIGQRVGKLISSNDPETVAVRVLPEETAWYVERSLLAGLSTHSVQSTTPGHANLYAEFGLSSLRVVYSNIRRDGILGPKVIDRKVTVLVSAKVLNQQSGSILVLKDFHEEEIDTIEFSELENVENPNLEVTQGVIPGEGFFSNIAEPLVVLSAIAIAVFLLFNVRS